MRADIPLTPCKDLALALVLRARACMAAQDRNGAAANLCHALSHDPNCAEALETLVESGILPTQDGKGERTRSG